MKGGPFGGEKLKRKSHNAEKTERGWDPLVTPGNVCYAEKEKNLFVQFLGPTGTI